MTTEGPWERSFQARELAQNPPMPLTRVLSTKVTEAEWEELEAILARREESVSDYLRYLLNLGIITQRALYNREPF